MFLALLSSVARIASFRGLKLGRLTRDVALGSLSDSIGFSIMAGVEGAFWAGVGLGWSSGLSGLGLGLGWSLG